MKKILTLTTAVLLSSGVSAAISDSFYWGTIPGALTNPVVVDPYLVDRLLCPTAFGQWMGNGTQYFTWNNEDKTCDKTKFVPKTIYYYSPPSYEDLEYTIQELQDELDTYK